MIDSAIRVLKNSKNPLLLSVLAGVLLYLHTIETKAQQSEEIAKIQITDVSAAVYVSAWRVEKEIIFKPLALQKFVDLGLSANSIVNLDKRSEIKKEISNLNSEFLGVSIDGTKTDFALEGVRFIEPRPDKSVPIDDNSTIGINDFVISIVSSAPLPKLDSTLSLEWKSGFAHQQEIPIRLADMIGSTLYQFNESQPKLDIAPRMAVNARDLPEAPEAPAPTPVKIPFSSFILAIVGIFLIGSSFKSAEGKRKKLIAGIVSFLMATMVWLALGKQQNSNAPDISQETATDMADRLLEGVYHSFNFDKEEMQYDILSQVAGSQALTDIYLEIRRTLAKREADGARVRVLNVNVTEAKAEKLADTFGYVLDCTWKAFGEVGHWGHFHRRNNRYAAKLKIEPIDGKWKLTSLHDIEREREITPSTTIE